MNNYSRSLLIATLSVFFFACEDAPIDPEVENARASEIANLVVADKLEEAIDDCENYTFSDDDCYRSRFYRVSGGAAIYLEDNALNRCALRMYPREAHDNWEGGFRISNFDALESEQTPFARSCATKVIALSNELIQKWDDEEAAARARRIADRRAQCSPNCNKSGLQMLIEIALVTGVVLEETGLGSAIGQFADYQESLGVTPSNSSSSSNSSNSQASSGSSVSGNTTSSSGYDIYRRYTYGPSQTIVARVRCNSNGLDFGVRYYPDSGQSSQYGTGSLFGRSVEDVAAKKCN